MPELLARIRALLRRRPRTSLPGVNLGDLTIDFSGHSVFRGGRDVPLTPREFAMLAYLANRPSIIVNRDELGAHLYDEGNDPISNAVDVLVGRLRRKLQVKGRPDPIQTRRGLGYQLVPVEPKESSK